jgi:hypothetical protein
MTKYNRPVRNAQEFGEQVEESAITTTTTRLEADDENEIINSLRAHNVVFVQDLNDGVVQGVRSQREDVKLLSSVTTISDGYVVTIDDGVIVIKFDAPESLTPEHMDCTSFIADALKYGVIILCNISWVKFFLELVSIEDDISISSVVIYNSSVFGPMGNTELYTSNKLQHG